MNITRSIVLASLLAISVPAVARAGAVDELMAGYKAAGGADFSAGKGQAMWNAPSVTVSKSGTPMSCSVCHTGDLRKGGWHLETGEPIEPMAPSATPKRLTDKKFIEKWFKRNCKEVYSRECTVQEKGDFLAFIGGK